MSKTISEVQQAKRDLEAKIAQMLLNFEKENGVEVSGCYCNSHDKASIGDEYSTVAASFPIHVIDFSISVRL